MKKAIPFFFLLLTNALNAQCYSKVISAESTIIALKTDGSLWARGQNLSGTAGNGTTTPVSSFTQIGTDHNWTETIDIDLSYVLAVKSDGTLWKWGNGLPVQVGTDADWVKVATGFAHFLAIKSNGTLWSWGYKDGGKLGTGNPDDDYVSDFPTQVGTAVDWLKVYTNTGGRSMAIKTDGTLWSWGNNGGYLGYAGANLNNAYRSPHQVGTDSNWVTVSTGTNYMTNAIKSNGTLWGWGFSNIGLFGNGIAFYSSDTPIQIGTDTDWKDISVSSNTTIALKTNGTRWGWGQNWAYQLGMGPGFNSDTTVPTQGDMATDWIYISNDKNYGWADGIKQDNSLYHWSAVYPSTVYASPTLFSPMCVLADTDFTSNDGIVIFPNPVADKMTVHLTGTKSGAIAVNIANMLGQTVFENKNIKADTANEIHLDTSNFAAGCYFINIKSDLKTFQDKIIKE